MRMYDDLLYSLLYWYFLRCLSLLIDLFNPFNHPSGDRTRLDNVWKRVLELKVGGPSRSLLHHVQLHWLWKLSGGCEANESPLVYNRLRLGAGRAQGRKFIASRGPLPSRRPANFGSKLPAFFARTADTRVSTVLMSQSHWAYEHVSPKPPSESL